MRGRAVSPVVATVIITSIMLTTVAVALYFSTSLIDAHRQMMEYESAKELLTYAATALEQVALGAGGARYVRFSLTSTSLNFERTDNVLQVIIRDSIYQYNSFTIRIPINRVSVCAGSLVSTVEDILYPEGAPLNEIKELLVDAGEPIVIVYESFQGRACAFLEARRVRKFFSGVTYAIENGQKKLYNFFTIHLVNITFGNLGGAGTIPLVIRNKEVAFHEYRFSSSSVIIEVNLNGDLHSEPLRGVPEAEGSIVIVKISEVEIATG